MQVGIHYTYRHPALLAKTATTLDVLARRCLDVGRGPAEITTTIMDMAPPLAAPDAFVARMAEYAALGVSLIEFIPPADDPVRFISEVGEKLVPRLGELS